MLPDDCLGGRLRNFVSFDSFDVNVIGNVLIART